VRAAARSDAARRGDERKMSSSAMREQIKSEAVRAGTRVQTCAKLDYAAQLRISRS